LKEINNHFPSLLSHQSCVSAVPPFEKILLPPLCIDDTGKQKQKIQEGMDDIISLYLFDKVFSLIR